MKAFEKISNFINRDVWRFRIRGRHSFVLRWLRVFIASFREFVSNHCALHASALTVYTLLSIVPVLAVVFGIAKGFGLDKTVKEQLIQNMQGQKEVLTQLMSFSENLLQNSQGGIIAGAGALLLFWSVIQVLSNIEKSFNSIWGIAKTRGWSRKFTDYLSMVVIFSFFFALAGSLTVLIVTRVRYILEAGPSLGILKVLIGGGIQILPFFIFWGMLTYLYIFMPNGKVNFTSALAGGFFAAVVYQIVQWAYIYFQIGASRQNAIYGTFAALPLFLIWLQTSWMIVLYGAELACAHQNAERYEYEQECRSASEEFKKLLLLRMTHLSVHRFANSQVPPTAGEISDELELPIRLTHELLNRLVQSRVLAAVQGDDEKDLHYQPGYDIHEMTVQFVAEKLEQAGSEEIPVAESAALKKLRQTMKLFNQTLERLPQNILLMKLDHSQTGHN